MSDKRKKTIAKIVCIVLAVVMGCGTSVLIILSALGIIG